MLHEFFLRVQARLFLDAGVMVVTYVKGVSEAFYSESHFALVSFARPDSFFLGLGVMVVV